MRFEILMMFGSVVIGSACLEPPGSSENTKYVIVKEPEIYFEGRIETFDVKLHDVEGRCVLSYAKVLSTGRSSVVDLDVGMVTPCNFIRASWNNYKPQSYTYQTGKNRRTVLLITGGPPTDPKINDEFQPNGCGTRQAKIRVFDDRIEIGWSGYNGPSWCPSAGADEVMFAT